MKTARLYNCARCHSQVTVCRHCDRGNLYCGPVCSRQFRAKNHRVANQIYQKTFPGRQKHALRQKHYRQRLREKVTDQGSLLSPPSDLLPAVENEAKEAIETKLEDSPCCSFCKKPVWDWLRQGFIRHYQTRTVNRSRYLRPP